MGGERCQVAVHLPNSGYSCQVPSMKPTRALFTWMPAGLGVAFGLIVGRVSGAMPMWLAVGIAFGGGVTALLYIRAARRDR